jgi:hypothetical protein
MNIYTLKYTELNFIQSPLYSYSMLLNKNAKCSVNANNFPLLLTLYYNTFPCPGKRTKTYKYLPKPVNLNAISYMTGCIKTMVLQRMSEHVQSEVQQSLQHLHLSKIKFIHI